MGFFRCGVPAEIPPLAASLDAGRVASSRRFAHAQQSSFVVAVRPPLVLRILCRRRLSQVRNAVVHPVGVDMVKAMGGRLDVESREGLGSRFIIRLPLADTAEMIEHLNAAGKKVA